MGKLERRLDNYVSCIDDIQTLIRTGRTAMALQVLESLIVIIDGAIMDAMASSYEEGRADLAREIRGEAPTGLLQRALLKAKTRDRAKPKRRPAPKNHEWLAARIADPELRERAKQVLRLDDALLDAIAEGGVGLGSSSWRKLREALGR
jgi:hypothetical protein